MSAFQRWWNDWAARNDALYAEAQRRRELAVARRWAQAHLDFHFGANSIKESNDHEQNHD